MFSPSPKSGRDLSSVINTLGGAEFGESLMSHLRQTTGADIVSAFEFSKDNEPSYLLGSGNTPPVARFSEAAGQRYANGFWRFDRALSTVMSSSSRFRYKVIFQRCYDIPNKEYRSFCYDSHEVLERASILAYAGRAPIMLNLYRCRGSGPFESIGISEIEKSGELLCALVAKHAEVSTTMPGANVQPDVGEVGKILHKAALGLSTQETEICAGLLAGCTYKEIARRRSLKLSSVVTYRKRAYAKLGIVDRNELDSIYKQIHSRLRVESLN